MNKRIRELAEQAGITIWGDAVYMHDAKDTLDSAVLEKFAELILQDCLNTCGREWVGLTDDEIDKLGGHPISSNLGEIMWVRIIEQELKEKNT